MVETSQSSLKSVERMGFQTFLSTTTVTLGYWIIVVNNNSNTNLWFDNSTINMNIYDCLATWLNRSFNILFYGRNL